MSFADVLMQAAQQLEAGPQRELTEAESWAEIARWVDLYCHRTGTCGCLLDGDTTQVIVRADGLRLHPLADEWARAVDELVHDAMAEGMPGEPCAIAGCTVCGGPPPEDEPRQLTEYSPAPQPGWLRGGADV